MLQGEREYDLLPLFFAAAAEPLRVIPRAWHVGEHSLTHLKTACVRTQVSTHLYNYIFKPNLLLPLQCTGGMKANMLLRGMRCKLVLTPDLTSFIYL